MGNRWSQAARMAAAVLPLAALQMRDALAEPATTRLLVGVAPGANPADLGGVHATLGADVIRTLDGSRIVIVDAPSSGDALTGYSKHPSVAFVEPDQPVFLPGRPPAGVRIPGEAIGSSGVGPGAALGALSADASGPAFAPPRSSGAPFARYPNDPLFQWQWHHEAIGSAEAWDRARAEGIVVALIDTGVQCDHPDLAAACVEGYDYFDDDGDPGDFHGHGTIEAGVVAAVTDNGIGVAGLARGASVMPLKVFGTGGQGSMAAVVSSIEHAADMGVGVINLSLGTTNDSPALEAAVRYAAGRGVLIAAAAGNGGQEPVYPAAYGEVIGVAGTYPDDGHPPFTTGDHLEVAAPGWDIVTTRLTGNGTYGRFSGTSEATPLVSGLAALLMGQNPGWTAERVRSRIIVAAVDLGEPGWDELFGWGRIDAGLALDPGYLPDPEPGPTPLRKIHLPLLTLGC